MTHSDHEADGGIQPGESGAQQPAADIAAKLDNPLEQAPHPPALGKETMRERVNRLEAMVSQLNEIHTQWGRRLVSVEAGLSRTRPVCRATEEVPRDVEETATRVSASVEQTTRAQRREVEVPDTAGHTMIPIGHAGESSRTTPQATNTARDTTGEKCACGETCERDGSGSSGFFALYMLALMFYMLLLLVAGL